MTLSSTPRRPGKTAVFRKEFRESLLGSLDSIRPRRRGERVELLMATGIVSMMTLVLVLLLEEADGRPLFQTRPLVALALAIVAPLTAMTIIGLVVFAMFATLALRDAFGAVRGKPRLVPTRLQRLTARWSDLAVYRRTLRELRDIRKGGLTLGNTPSLRACIDDAFREGSRPSSRRWLERRLAAKLLLAGERHRRELQTWLDSDESFHAALSELRSLYGNPRTETRLGPADTVWVYNGSPGTEISLRLLREFLPGRTEPKGMGVVCTPREVYELLRRSDERATYMTIIYSSPRMRVTPRIGRGSVPLDGADPEMVAKLYDPSEASPYSDLNELVAAAKLL